MAQSTALVTRPVECRDQNGSGVDYSFCNPATMPATGQVQVCTDGNTYSWTGTRGICQPNPLSCQPLIVNTINQQICSALTRDTCATESLCMAQPSLTDTQTMDYICKNQNGTTVADGLCTQPKPVSTRPCNETTTTGVCTPKLFPVKKVDRAGNILEWQHYDVYNNNRILVSAGDSPLTERLNRVIANYITYFNALNYNPNTYGDCMVNNLQY